MLNGQVVMGPGGRGGDHDGGVKWEAIMRGGHDGVALGTL